VPIIVANSLSNMSPMKARLKLGLLVAIRMGRTVIVGILQVSASCSRACPVSVRPFQATASQQTDLPMEVAVVVVIRSRSW
jgi:hypothetical protein